MKEGEEELAKQLLKILTTEDYNRRRKGISYSKVVALPDSDRSMNSAINPILKMKKTLKII